MRINCVITPLKCDPASNKHFVDKAVSDKADFIPKLVNYHEVWFNAKSIEMCGDTEVELSAIEKIKCHVGELELGKPAKVTIDFGSYSMNGQHGLTTKICGTW